MADGFNVLPFPLKAPLRVQEQAPAGRHFPPVEEIHPAVEVDRNRVLIRGRHFRTFVGETAAARVAAALMTFEAYGLLDSVKLELNP